MNPYPDICPICEFNLDGGDIYEEFLAKYNGDAVRALEAASCYGWTEQNPRRWSKALAYYDRAEDRTAAWLCPECNGWIK